MRLLSLCGLAGAATTLVMACVIASPRLAGEEGPFKSVDPKGLPKPYATPSAGNTPKLVPQPEGAALQVPKGFNVNLFAEGLNNPRNLTVAPNGDVFVVESGPNRVTLLRDSKGTGKADVKQVFAE